MAEYKKLHQPYMARSLSNYFLMERKKNSAFHWRRRRPSLLWIGYIRPASLSLYVAEMEIINTSYNYDWKYKRSRRNLPLYVWTWYLTAFFFSLINMAGFDDVKSKEKERENGAAVMNYILLHGGYWWGRKAHLGHTKGE